MKTLKKYTWAFIVATLIAAVVTAYTCETGNASNKKKSQESTS